MALTTTQYSTLKLILRALLSGNTNLSLPNITEAQLFGFWNQLAAEAAGGAVLPASLDIALDFTLRARLTNGQPVRISDADWASFFTTLTTDSSGATALSPFAYASLKTNLAVLMGGISNAALLGYLNPRVGGGFVAFAGKQLTSLSATSFLGAAGTTSTAVRQNQTLACLFYWAPGGVDNNQAVLWSAEAGLNGWLIQYTGTNAPAFHIEFGVGNGSAFPVYDLGLPVLGLNCVVITRTAGDVYRTSMNGGAVAGTSLAGVTPTDPTVAATHSIGGTYSGGVPGWDTGGVLECLRLNRLATDTELQAWSGCVYPATFTNRFALPAALTGDAAVTFDWLASRDWDGAASTSVSGGSSPVTFTVTGTPTLTAMSEQYTTALTASFNDTEPVVATSGYLTASTYARLKFSAPSTQPQVAVAYINNDGTANSTEMVPSYVDGAWKADIPATVVTGSIGLAWLQVASYNAAIAAHNIEFWTPVRADPTLSGATPIGGFIAGVVTGAAPTFPVSTPAKRMVLYGDSVSCSVFANTGGLGWPARIRADFPTSGGPGGVTVHAYGGRRLFDDVGGVSAPNAAVFAAKLVADAQVVSTSSKVLVSWIGFNDLSSSSYTSPQFVAAMQALINAVTAADAQITIYVLNLPQPGRSGYNAGIATLTGCTKIDTTGWGLTYVDGIHPDAASQATIKNNLKTAIGY